MPNDRFTLDDFDFDLPDELVAQHPAGNRSDSRLMVLERASGSRTHVMFSGLTDFLRKGDLLVFNDARVLNARIMCRRTSGGEVEIFLLRKVDDRRWRALSNRMRRLKNGEPLSAIADPSLNFTPLFREGDEIEIESSVPLTEDLLARVGVMALPPYIRRKATDDDRVRYQTVYSRKAGAVAAPTAGLHFSEEMFVALETRGVQTAFLTLYVSFGTFQPVRTRELGDHVMHRETYILDERTADRINRVRDREGRIIAVGTTSLRVLETTFREGKNHPGEGETSIFIYPPYEIRSADCLLTNFHTPRSTLLMLVSAFAGYESIMTAYREAIAMGYRFFSYGDAMLIC